MTKNNNHPDWYFHDERQKYPCKKSPGANYKQFSFISKFKGSIYFKKNKNQFYLIEIFFYSKFYFIHKFYFE